MFSDRVLNINVSSTANLLNEETRLRENGTDIISFSVGEPDFTTPVKTIEEAYKKMLEGKTHYTTSKGIKELRIAIANKYLSENKMDVDPDNVIITPAKYAIYMAIATYVNKGDEVLYPDPGWVSYPDMIKLNEAMPVPYNLKEKSDYALDHDHILTNIHKSTKMIIINTPSNPAGSMLGYEDLKFLRDVATDHKIMILSDEIYEKIIFEGTHISIGSLDGMEDYTVTVNGFSKSYAMTGWRIGYLIAPKPAIEQIEKIQQQTITCAPSFAQYAAVQALTDRESVKNMVAEFLKRRNLISKFLGDFGVFQFTLPKSTFYIFPKVSYRNMNDYQFSEFLLKKANVSVVPGSSFGKNGKNHVRISFATSQKNIEKGIEKIKKVL